MKLRKQNHLHICIYIDSNNKTISALLTKITERIAKISNNIVFFELHLGKLDKKMQKDILLNQQFKHYHYFLEKIFEQSSYQLSEAEEKIMTLKMLPSYQMWVDTNDKAIGKLTVK